MAVRLFDRLSPQPLVIGGGRLGSCDERIPGAFVFGETNAIAAGCRCLTGISDRLQDRTPWLVIGDFTLHLPPRSHTFRSGDSLLRLYNGNSTLPDIGST
jgi:hypothetical protein